MVFYEAPKAPVSEVIRNLRTNITYKMNQTGMNTFLITSSSPEEGKSFITSNLGIAFSQSRKKVLIIDCDLRRGKQHKIFGVDNTYGLSQALENNRIKRENLSLNIEIDNLVQNTEVDNLFVIPAGRVPDNPAELFENGRFDVIFEFLKDKYDVILFDVPPINIVTDTMTLCNKADGVIILCSIGQTKSDVLLETKEKIESMEGNIIGVVVNKMPTERMKAYTKEYTKYSTDGSKIIFRK